jgi:hypothetical protein
MQNTEQLTFDCLATELRRLVVNSPPLQLDDVAKVATTCKLFGEVASERRAADEQWLAQAAVSAFGERFIDLLLFVLTDPVADDGGLDDGDYKTFDLTTGKPFPSTDDVRGLSQVVLLTAAPEADPIKWVVTKGSLCHHLEAYPCNLESKLDWVLVYFLGDEEEEVFLCRFKAPSAPGIPYLGLSLLAFKRVRARRAMTGRSLFESRRHEHPMFREFQIGCASAYLLFLVGNLYESVRYRWVLDARPLPDVTRAMNVLRMVARRSHSRLRYFHAVRPLQLSRL